MKMQILPEKNKNLPALCQHGSKQFYVTVWPAKQSVTVLSLSKVKMGSADSPLGLPPPCVAGAGNNGDYHQLGGFEVPGADQSLSWVLKTRSQERDLCPPSGSCWQPFASHKEKPGLPSTEDQKGQGER